MRHSFFSHCCKEDGGMARITALRWTKTTRNRCFSEEVRKRTKVDRLYFFLDNHLFYTSDLNNQRPFSHIEDDPYLVIPSLANKAVSALCNSVTSYNHIKKVQ